MYGCVPHYVPGTPESRTMALDPLKLESQIAMNCHMAAGDKTWAI